MDGLLGGSMVELMVTSSKRTYAIGPKPQVCCSWSPCPCSRSLLTLAFAGCTQTPFCLSLWGVSWCAQGMFEHSEPLWQVWDLILNAISPLLSSCLASPFPRTWGIFSKSLQHCTAAAQEPGSCHSSTYCQIHINHIWIYKPVYCNVCACKSTLVFIELGICTCLPVCMHSLEGKCGSILHISPHLRILSSAS